MDTFFVSSIWSKAAMELEITDSMIIFSGVIKWEVLPFCLGFCCLCEYHELASLQAVRGGLPRSCTAKCGPWS